VRPCPYHFLYPGYVAEPEQSLHGVQLGGEFQDPHRSREENFLLVVDCHAIAENTDLLSGLLLVATLSADLWEILKQCRLVAIRNRFVGDFVMITKASPHERLISPLEVLAWLASEYHPLLNQEFRP
jgi:hypothetical protein